MLKANGCRVFGDSCDDSDSEIDDIFNSLTKTAAFGYNPKALPHDLNPKPRTLNPKPQPKPQASTRNSKPQFPSLEIPNPEPLNINPKI